LTPSLSQVLSQGGAAAHPSLNPLYWLAGISVFLLGAFSAVKGFELYRRWRLIPSLVNEAASLADIQNNEEAEKLSFLAGQNRELQGKIMELADVLSNVKQTRDTLERSNLALAKESARLKGEKEELVLRACEPLIAVKTDKKTEPVAAAKKKMIRLVTKAVRSKTKKGDRKPKRVSRKTK
jgi:hypothetical protein